MTSPRKTWTRPQAPGGFVEPVPALREKYAPALVELIELHATMLRNHRDAPSYGDVRHTLEAIAQAPESAAFDRLDGLTKAMLDAVAWRHHHTMFARKLPLPLLRECAVVACTEFASLEGRTATDASAVQLLRGLLALTPEWTAAQRTELFTDALRACGIGAGEKNLERLVAEARREVF